MLETVSARRRRGPLLPAAKLFDRAGMRAKIAALHADARPVEAARPEALALFRGALDHGRALVRAALEDNGSGLVCAGQLAHIEDELIHAIHDYVVTYVHPAEEAASAKSCVIAAVGGYGRATLAPGSDIDLLFLLPDAAPRRCQSVVQSILYVLWDLGQKVGHSTRTIEECLDEARGDMTVRTALLEARFLIGEAALFETMRTRFEREIVHRIGARIRRRQARRTRRPRRQGRPLALSRRAERQGRQRRPARPQHAVLDREIRLRGARGRGDRPRRPVLARRISGSSAAARNFSGASGAISIS